MFDHIQAQRYERDSAENCMQSDFRALYSRFEEAKREGSLWHGATDQWFQNDTALWKKFVEQVRNRHCLEIGSGPYGYLSFCHWIKNRYVIDPLVDFYRTKQLELTGSTLFTDDIKTFGVRAEQLIHGLVGKIDGFVVCRNCLDHCEDPLTILNNISKYSIPGSYLLFWTDLWHLDGTDEGHTNITKSPEMMDLIFEGLGYSILKRSNPVREASNYLEYGILARRERSLSII